MTAAEAEGAQEPPEAPETTASPEEPEIPEEDSEETVDEVSEDEETPAEPDIYEFSEPSGYTVGELEPAYGEIDEDSYQVDEEAEKVLVGSSDWDSIERLLSEDEGGSPDNSWSDRIKNYLFDHDTEYAAGGATGIGAGILTASLGYTVAGGLMITGGGAALGWGVGSYLGDRISEYFSDDGQTEEPEDEEESEEDIDHELGDYSEWEVEVVDEESYGQAVEEYIQESQE